jgi:hypothetical protein
MKNETPKKSKETKVRDQYTVVLEDIHSQIKGVAEGVTMLSKKFDRHVKENQESFALVNENMRLMRTEISLIRHNQVTRDEFKFPEDRVSTIEKRIATQ